MAVEVLGSKPMINVSIGTKIPPPPTPPMLPKAAPRNPMMEPSTTLHPNSMSCPMFHQNQFNLDKVKEHTYIK